MGFVMPAGYAECDTCGDMHEMELAELAYDGCWQFDPEDLPGGWLYHRGEIYCPGCADDAMKELKIGPYVEGENKQ